MKCSAKVEVIVQPIYQAKLGLVPKDVEIALAKGLRVENPLAGVWRIYLPAGKTWEAVKGSGGTFAAN